MQPALMIQNVHMILVNKSTIRQSLDNTWYVASSSALTLASAEVTEQLALARPRRKNDRNDVNNNMALMLDAPVLENKG